MNTAYGHLTYCTNIHSGEGWEDHFSALKRSVPVIKRKLSPSAPFGIGLRLSNAASLQLAKEGPLELFKSWLKGNNCYVFTMNGFPYGNFHHQRVKDLVHAPDWTTPERVQYTIRMFRILAALLPLAESCLGERLEGGISTSPLSYRLWFGKDEEREEAMENATFNLLQVVEQLLAVRRTSGLLLHLDLEPEPDGLIENTGEFIHWYAHYLLPLGVPLIQEKFRFTKEAAEAAIRDHVRICFDICHAAVGYEEPGMAMEELSRAGIKTGKLQISAALRMEMNREVSKREAIAAALEPFNESVYLHQVVAKTTGSELLHYPDLPDALKDIANAQVNEWRSHFHVPVFVNEYGILRSTRGEIEKTLLLQQQQRFTDHLEVETYTWEVLPGSLKLPVEESIARELDWVLRRLR